MTTHAFWREKHKSYHRKKRLEILLFIDLEVQLTDAEIEETKLRFHIPISPFHGWDGSECWQDEPGDFSHETIVDYEDCDLLKTLAGVKKMKNMLKKRTNYLVRLERRTMGHQKGRKVGKNKKRNILIALHKDLESFL